MSGKSEIWRTAFDGSAIIAGLLLAFNLPPTVPFWMVPIGSLVAIGVAKHTFGGLGYNLFNPALVARIFLLISFPVQMTAWTEPYILENRCCFRSNSAGSAENRRASGSAGRVFDSRVILSAQFPAASEKFPLPLCCWVPRIC